MTKQAVRVLSGVPRFDGTITDWYAVEANYIREDDTFTNGMRLFSRARGYDIVLMNSSTRGLLGLCLMRWVWPFHRWRLVSLDIHLNEPIGWKQRIATLLKRVLLKKVDLHILFFNDLSGYERWFGITSAKSKFVPFKVNSWETISHDETANGEGEYVFCGGRSLRDLETFKRAMAQVPFPGLLLYQQDPSFMALHGTPVDLAGLPPNVKPERHDGNNDTWIDYIRRAKIVVIPTFANSIYAPGLSLYLLAMALRRCVIISEGPQTHGLLDKEAVIVPPEDSGALARAIRKVWEDSVFRKQVADTGRKYAEQCAGEKRMLTDIANACGDLLSKRNCPESEKI
jgi:glycosyltransferase involved in cell wall biosynthesis